MLSLSLYVICLQMWNMWNLNANAPFCKMWQSRLSRHMYTVSKANPQGTEVLEPSTTSVERIHTFADLRKECIFTVNMFLGIQSVPAYQRERKVSSHLLCCSFCKGFYSKKQFHKHKEICRPNTSDNTLSSVPVDAFKSMKATEDEFTTEILAKCHNDEIWKVCRSYPTIVLIGRRRFQRNRGKVDKLMEMKESTMTEMRLLSKLLIAFSVENTAVNVSAEDMFIRMNFAVLLAAIEKVTTADGTSTLKHWVENGLYYFLKYPATIVMTSHLGSGDDNKAVEVQKFIQYLDMNRYTIFAGAVYSIN